MQYRQMGEWGVKLSTVGLGSYLTIGFKVDEETSKATVRAAYESGINFFDTANAYNTGEGEKMLGKCPAFGHTDDGMSPGRFGYADDHSSQLHVRTDGSPRTIASGHIFLLAGDVLRSRSFT